MCCVVPTSKNLYVGISGQNFSFVPLVLIVCLYPESAKLILYNAVTTEHNAGTPLFENCCAQVFRNHFVSAKYEIGDAVHAFVIGVGKGWNDLHTEYYLCQRLFDHKSTNCVSGKRHSQVAG